MRVQIFVEHTLHAGACLAGTKVSDARLEQECFGVGCTTCKLKV